MSLKFRTFYFTVTDMKKAATFWEGVLKVKPHKSSDYWHEFMCENGVRFGLLYRKDYKPSSCNGAPVFEFDDDKVRGEIDRVVAFGATIVVDGLDDPNIKGAVLADPFGNEFEFTRFHA